MTSETAARQTCYFTLPVPEDVSDAQAWFQTGERCSAAATREGWPTCSAATTTHTSLEPSSTAHGTQSWNSQSVLRSINFHRTDSNIRAVFPRDLSFSSEEASDSEEAAATGIQDLIATITTMIVRPASGNGAGSGSGTASGAALRTGPGAHDDLTVPRPERAVYANDDFVLAPLPPPPPRALVTAASASAAGPAAAGPAAADSAARVLIVVPSPQLHQPDRSRAACAAADGVSADPAFMTATNELSPPPPLALQPAGAPEVGLAPPHTQTAKQQQQQQQQQQHHWQEEAMQEREGAVAWERFIALDLQEASVPRVSRAVRCVPKRSRSQLVIPVSGDPATVSDLLPAVAPAGLPQRHHGPGGALLLRVRGAVQARDAAAAVAAAAAARHGSGQEAAVRDQLRQLGVLVSGPAAVGDSAAAAAADGGDDADAVGTKTRSGAGSYDSGWVRLVAAPGPGALSGRPGAVGWPGQGRGHRSTCYGAPPAQAGRQQQGALEEEEEEEEEQQQQQQHYPLRAQRTSFAGFAAAERSSAACAGGQHLTGTCASTGTAGETAFRLGLATQPEDQPLFVVESADRVGAREEPDGRLPLGWL